MDLIPSPMAERPGLVIRDPMRFSDAIVIVPWEIAPSLECFDGEHTQLDLKAELARRTGSVDVSRLQEDLYQALSQSGFLEDEAFARVREERLQTFQDAEVRESAHAGSAYPTDPEELDKTMQGYIDPCERAAECDGIVGIAAPHVSPFGGWQSYRAAYSQLAPDLADRTFVVLGTSHYGEPDKFGLTRKSFETPLGRTATAVEVVNELEARAPGAVGMEDYCHAVEHSIEFQVLFLQWLFGPGIRVVPVLCGSFFRAFETHDRPEQDEHVARFLGALGELAARGSKRLVWVLGVDMAHIGRRYGDRVPARANRGHLVEVAARDAARNERIAVGDARGFWDLVRENKDDLRWCGSSPIYTFLYAVPGVEGTVHRYEQWNIDEASVVSFAGISFRAR